MEKLFFIATPIFFAILIRKALTTVLFLTILLLIGTCKKTPTFSADNTFDNYSDNYIPPKPQNVDFTIDSDNFFNVTWETDEFELIKDEAVFLVELIIDSSIVQEIIKTESFINSTRFSYTIEPNRIYKISVTTIYNENKSEPSFSNSTLNIDFSKTTEAFFYQENPTTLIFSWVQRNQQPLDQEIYLKNISTNEVLTYKISANLNNQYSITFSDLYITNNYEVGITKTKYGLKSDTYIASFNYSADININKVFSLNMSAEGISFFQSAYIPYTEYLISTKSSGSEIYVINKKSRAIERTINNFSPVVSNLIGRSDGTFYTYNPGSIYEGNIYTGSYSLLLDITNSNSKLPFFGLTGFEYQYLYYPTNDKIIFRSIVEPPEEFEIGNDNVDNLCTGYMEDQFVTLSDNVASYYSFPAPELRSTFTASEGIYFHNCEFNNNLDKVYLTGFNSNTKTHFFGYLDKSSGTLKDFTILSTETGFGDLYLNQLRNQMILSTFDPETGELKDNPFYVYDLDDKMFTITELTYKGLNLPNHSILYNGNLIYTTELYPRKLEEIFIGDGWVMIEN